MSLAVLLMAHGTPATLDEMPERYSAPVRLRLEVGRYLLAEDYLRALRGREVLREAVDRDDARRTGLTPMVLPVQALDGAGRLT